MQNELTDAFGDTLKKFRNRKGWSQMEFANRAGMHLNALGNLERAKRNPSLQTIFVLCKALEVSVAHFMGEVEKALPEESKRKSTGFWDDTPHDH